MEHRDVVKQKHGNGFGACRLSKQAEFRRLEEENASAPERVKLTEEEMIIDPGYDAILDQQGKELCEEVRTLGSM